MIINGLSCVFYERSCLFDQNLVNLKKTTKN